MTNAGIVLPDPGYHEALRELTREHGTLLIIDETHTFCAGPGGYTAAAGLDPDLLTIGKAIAGGMPAAAYGMTEEVAERIADHIGLARDHRCRRDRRDACGQRAVARRGPGDPRGGPHRRGVRHMTEMAERFEAGVNEVVASQGVPWNSVRLGCRVEYHFQPSPPRNGSEAVAAADRMLVRYMHLHALNRGILLTPFHNMALMCPATTESDIDRHTEAFEEAVAGLTAKPSA